MGLSPFHDKNLPLETNPSWTLLGGGEDREGVKDL